MKVGFKRAPDKARLVPKAGGQGKIHGASGNTSPPAISKKLAAAKAELAAKRALEAAAAESAEKSESAI